MEGGEMLYTRRDAGKIGLAAGLASMFGSKTMAAAKPNSKIAGVQIGAITYSYRSMPDQSAEATLKYILDSGLSAVELMDGPAENFAGAPSGRGGGPGGFGGGRGGARGGAPAGPPELREG